MPEKKRTTKKIAKKAAAKPKKADSKEHALSVHDLSGKVLETMKLDALFSSGPVNTDVVYQAVIMYQAGQRSGTASTKDRGHVRGGGKKPWKQKGTGQARHGSRRSPIWRGGGVTFGPMPRDYSYTIPAEIRRQAVVEVVKDKIVHDKLTLVNQAEIAAPKTKLVANILNVFKLKKPLFLVEKRTDNLRLASRNIRGVSIKTAEEVNALDLASHQECVMTKGAYSGLLKRLKP
ncbi:MAG: 50S ribosomal protein L4 [Candidatus Omnitrophota bacterium]